MLFFDGAPGITFSGGPPPPRQYPQTGVALPRPVAGVPKAAVFDQGTSMAGTREIVWGGAAGRTGVYNSYYTTKSRRNVHDDGILWCKLNHPDWLVFNADGVTPFEQFYYPNSKLPELDIKNPAVRDYIFGVCAPPIAAGYPCIAFDNTSMPNVGADSNQHRAGHYVGRTYDSTGAVVTSGAWVQDYIGATDDQVWENALIDYIGDMRRRFNAAGASLMINADYDPTRPAQMRRLLQAADIYFSEDVPAHGDGNDLLDGHWLNFFQIVTDYVTRGGVWFNSQQMRGTTLASVPLAEKTWMLANFLLMRGDRSYFSAYQATTFFSYDATWSPAVGLPVEASQPAAASAWTRRYTSGFVAVNPSSTVSQSVTIPAGTWTDLAGTSVAAGAVTISPASGLVLIKS